jgi:hypothetical protein
MANINLVTNKEEGGTLGAGIGMLLVFFVLIALVYGGLLFYGKQLDTNTKIIDDEFKSKSVSFIASDANKVVDFQSRLAISEELLARERSGNRDIAKIEEAMIAGVFIGSYKYDDAIKTITLDCFADNYETIAKQILSFKSFDYFSNVLAGETKFDTKNNKINFPVVLTIK